MSDCGMAQSIIKTQLKPLTIEFSTTKCAPYSDFVCVYFNVLML